jgi:DNA-directed RNA polymerase specialized sigma24 family protein
MPELAVSRRDAIARFYARCHRGLSWAVRRSTGGVDDDLIREACAMAWLALMRRSDISFDGRGYTRLVVTATHEARRVYAAGRDIETTDPDSDAVAAIDELHDPFAHDHDPLERALDAELHADRRRRMAELRPREQRDMLLKAAGYSYAEIASLTSSARTAVNRRLTEGRVRLRGEL